MEISLLGPLVGTGNGSAINLGAVRLRRLPIRLALDPGDLPAQARGVMR